MNIIITFGFPFPTPTVTDDVSYSSLINMQEVKDDSSDFELPDHITETLEM